MSRFIMIIVGVSAILIAAILLLIASPKLALPVFQTPTVLSLPKPDKIDFQDISLKWDVIAKHTQSSKHITAMTETLGSGICVFDFNLDGWMDIFFVGGSGHSQHYGKKSWWNNDIGGNRLLININGEHFEDITEQAGLTKRIWGMGCAIADLNNDGFNDLIVSGLKSNTVYKNSGDGSFEDITSHSGLDNTRWSTGASFADFNKDGLIDIYISNYIRYQKGARTFERTSGFRTTSNVAFDPILYDPEPNQLFINMGNFKFKDVTNKAGVSNSLGRSLGARWVDLNHDDWLDLIVINDHNSPNQVFINNKGSVFSRANEQFNAFEIAGAHDLLMGDFNNNGQDDFFMSRGMSHPPVFLSKTGPSSQGRKSIYRDLAWEKKIAQAKLLPFTSWGSASGDFNNDGFIDIYVANGMIMPDLDSHFVSQAQENSLFINQGNGVFEWHKGQNNQQHAYSSRGAVTADLNNDGMLEVLVSNNNDPLQIFENQGSNKHAWFGLDLLSANQSVDIYGTVVEILTDRISIKRTLTFNQSFLSQSDPRLHFGLGNSTQIKSIILHWPDGKSSAFKDISPNQYYQVEKTNNTIQATKQYVKNTSDKLSWLNQRDDATLIALSDLLLQAPINLKIDKLEFVWNVGGESTKAHILEYIQEHWDVKFLPIVLKSLSNKNSQIRIAGIEIFRLAELETSVSWLLPLLRDSDPDIQCAAANTFTFFFDEEEAVTHRKNLAITPLIKALESDKPSVKICAANALAAAENKRAIAPLIKLSMSNASADVRSATIRALGLIRDTQVNSQLVSIIQSPTAEGEIITETLVALKRLNESSLDSIIKQLFKRSSDKAAEIISDAKLFQVLTFLFKNQDTIVFPKKQLDDHLEQLIHHLASHNNSEIDGQITKENTELKVQSSESIVFVLQAIEASRSEVHISFVEKQLSHKNKDIQKQALRTLLAIGSIKSKYLFESFFAERPLVLAPETLIKTEHQLPGFSLGFYQLLAQRASNNTQDFEDVFKLFSLLPHDSANRLFNKLISQTLESMQYKRLFDLCALNKNAYSLTLTLTYKEAKNKFPDSDLLYAYASCYFSSQPSLNQMDILKKRLFLKSFLNEPSWNKNQQTEILLAASETDILTTKTLLVSWILDDQANLISPEKMRIALQIINKHKLVSTIEPMLWSSLEDKSNTLFSRFNTASLLIQTDEVRVLNYLNRQFFEND